MRFLKNSLLILFFTFSLFLIPSLWIYSNFWPSFDYFQNHFSRNRSAWAYPEAKDHDYTYGEKNQVMKFSKFTTRIDLPKDHSEKEKHLIVAGGSNTIGWGLSGKETLASHIQTSENLKEYREVLFGYGGWGPSHVLERLKTGDLKRLVKNESGIFIYQFFDFQIKRVCGSPSYYAWSFGAAPFYTVKNGQLFRDGFMYDQPSFHFDIFNFELNKIKKNYFGMKSKVLSHEELLQRILTPTCKQLLLAVMLEMKKSYLAQFPKGKFYILNLFSVHDEEDSWIFKDKIFQESELNFLYPRSFALNYIKKNQISPEALQQADGHISSEYNHILSQFYNEKLSSLE